MHHFEMCSTRIAALCVLIGAATACRDSEHTVRATAIADAATARAVAVADAAATDAPAAPCANAQAFRFGALTAPAGWCWRRTAEGDDQSGVVTDASGRVRMRYYAMSLDETVGDACDAHRPGVQAIHDDLIRGVAYRSCTLGDGRRCVSFHGRANVCTEWPDASDAPLTELVHTLQPRP